MTPRIRIALRILALLAAAALIAFLLVGKRAAWHLSSSAQSAGAGGRLARRLRAAEAHSLLV